MSVVLFGVPSISQADMIIYSGGASDVNTAGDYTNNVAIDAIVVDGDQNSLTNTSTINNGAAGPVSTDVLTIDGGVTLGTLDNQGSINNSVSGSNPLQINGTITNFINSGVISSSAAGSATVILNGQVSSLNNTGGVIESSVDARALWITSTQLNALTNSGTIRNTNGVNGMSSDAIRVAADQTQIFTNTGTITGSNDAIEATGDANFLLDNQGTITGSNSYGINLDGNSDATVTNSGTLTGAFGAIVTIDGAGSGLLDYTNAAGGIVTGSLDIRSNAAHDIDLQGGSINGNILLNGATGNAFSISDGASVTGDVDLGSGAIHTVTVTGGTINGEFDVGTTAGTIVAVNPSAGVIASFLNAGNNAFRGEQTTIQMNGAGTLRINGNVTDAVGGDLDHLLDINSGTLEFTGTSNVQGGIDSDGATITLGLNKVTIGNTTDISADSILSLELNGANNGSLVNGAVDATITVANNATVSLSSITGVSLGDTFTIIDATGAGGGANLSVDETTISVVGASGNLDFNVQKVGDILQLVAVASTAGLTSNALSAQQVSSDAFAGDATMTAALAGLSGDARNEAYESLGNYNRISVVQGAIQSQSYQSNIVQQRLFVRLNNTGLTGISTGDETPAAARNFWAQGLYFQGEQDDEGVFDGYEARSTGLSFGMDKALSFEGFEDVFIGVSGNYSHTNSDMNNQDAETDIDTFLASAYGAAKWGAYLFQGQLTAGYSQFDSARQVLVGAVTRTASADFDGYQFGANVQAARIWEVDRFKIEPALLASYSALYTEDYAETGATTANLIVDDEFSQEITLGTSLAVSSEFQSDGYSISPRLEVGYAYDVLGEDIESTQRFEGGGASFSTSGLTPSRHSGFIGGDVTIVSSGNLEFSVGYRYSIREGFAGHNADAKLAMSF